jgi:hypothetical protein
MQYRKPLNGRNRNPEVTFHPFHKIEKTKAIPVTGCGGPQDCETSILPHFPDNWLADSGEAVSFMYWPFLLEAESTPEPL